MNTDREASMPAEISAPVSRVANPPSLAIGVCTFNRGPAIEATLRAIAAMDWVGGRVTRCVVVDNNSTDATPAVVDQVGAELTSAGSRGVRRFERVVEPAQGLAEARRRLFEHTNEPWVALLDDDVIPNPVWAREVLSAIDAQPRAGAVGGVVRLSYEQGESAWASRSRVLLAAQDLGPALRVLDRPRDNLVGAAMALRRDAVERSGWLAERFLIDRQGAKLSSGGDQELCIRVRQAGFEIVYAPGAIADHLIPPRRTQRRYVLDLRESIARADPWIDWLIAGRPMGEQGESWAAPKLARATRNERRTRLLEWRPVRRAVRLAERRGRLEGWKSLMVFLARNRPEGAPARLPVHPVVAPPGTFAGKSADN
ncbi:MAG: glycosyltransferase [Planctomycetota bacterium]|nr:glycosyltransferase [Planctomycetota bacterium]